MRVYASLGALAVGLLGLTTAEAFSPDDGYGGGTCAPTATTTVFVTVPATNAASPLVEAGPQTVTVTIPAPVGSGVSSPQNPVPPVYTVTVQTFGPGDSSPYTGPRPWESRLTATAVATHTVTLLAPGSVPPGSDGGAGSPGSGAPGSGTPGSGTPDSGNPGSGNGSGAPGTGNPGAGTGDGSGFPGTGSPDSGSPDSGSPGSGDGSGSSSGSPGSESGGNIPFDPDCATVITTTLYRTAPDNGNGSPTVDTVVATFTVTYPEGAGGSPNDGSGTPATTPAPGAPVGGQLQPSVITRTIYQPALASGPLSPSQNIIVETITVQAQDPNAPGGDGNSPAGATPAPPAPGGIGGPYSVITTTLYHPRTIPGQDTVTVDTIVATFTIAFPPASPTDIGSDGSPGSPAGAENGVTLITTTWYETTTCLDPFGNPTPTVVTHATTIASVLPLQPPATGGPGSGDASQASADNGDLVTVITETVYRPTPSSGSNGPNGQASPVVDTIVATITANFPDNSGSGNGEIVTVIVTTLYVTATPAVGSPGEATPSDGAIVQTLTVTIPNPSPAPGGQWTGAPAPTPGSGAGIGAGNVITTSLYRTATYIGPDGQPTVSTETYVATLTAGIPPTGPLAPTAVPPGPSGNNPQVTVITQTIYPSGSAPDGYGSSGAPGSGTGNGTPGSGAPGSGTGNGNGTPGSGAPGSGTGNGTPGSGAPGSDTGNGNGAPGSGVPGSASGSAPSIIVFTSTLLPSTAIPNDNPFDNGFRTVITATFHNPTATGPNDNIVQTLTYFFPPGTPNSDGSLPGTPTFAPAGLPGSGASGAPGAPGSGGTPGEVPPAGYGSALTTGPVPPGSPGGGADDISGTLYLTSTFFVTQTVPADYGNGLEYLSLQASLPCPLLSLVPQVLLRSRDSLASASPALASPPPVNLNNLVLVNLVLVNLASVNLVLVNPASVNLVLVNPVSVNLNNPVLVNPVSVNLNNLVLVNPASVNPVLVNLASVNPNNPVSVNLVQASLSLLLQAAPLPCRQHPPSGIPPAQQGSGIAGVLGSEDCSSTVRTLVVTSVQTSTYFNIVPELTTTYTFPYQALVTIESTIVTTELAPTLLRRFKRQNNEPLVFANTTSPAHSSPKSFTLPFDVTLTTITPTAASTPLLRFKRQNDAPIFANTTTSRPTVLTEEPSLSTLFPKTTRGNFTETSSKPHAASHETTSRHSTSSFTSRHSTSSPTNTPNADGLHSVSAESSALILTASATIPVQVPICTGATEVGNQVLDFDELPVGPLYNPYSRFWFSTGFLVAPPPSVPYTPSSGGQLLEFVPPVLSNGTLDTAQFGAGIDAASNCFRFNFFGANLGCDARGENQFCEFTFTGYRFNSTLNAETEVMSQLTWVPSCPDLNECDLTPFVVEDFNNISSVLVTLRVDGKSRTWWADDLKVGWSDNSCDAAHCRAGTPPHTAKRHEQHQPVWYWTIEGLRRLGSRAAKFRS
ncbi:hypothetical protein ACHAQA_007953 [Verticillium albo-atrum]